MPYESTPIDIRRAWLLALAYVLLAIGAGVMLFKIWPPTPWPGDQDFGSVALARAYKECGYPTPLPTPSSSPGPANNSSEKKEPPAAAIPIRFVGQMCLNTTFDERLILLVIVAGMLGSFVHASTSLADYIGNNNFSRNWSWFYLLRPFIGMALALVFYFVIRGGFLTTSGGAKDINPYGIAALAGLVGMFSKQATDKLSEVFSTLFRSAPGEGDDKRKDSLAGDKLPTLEAISPTEVKAGSTRQSIIVTGSEFSEGSKLYADDEEQATVFQSATRLMATLADDLIANPGTLKLKVVNPNNTESTPVDLIVSAGNNSGEVNDHGSNQ